MKMGVYGANTGQQEALYFIGRYIRTQWII
jgi:hypothetical protein